jgi:Fic family protein
LPTFLHEHPDWPDFRWNARRIEAHLGALRHRLGLLLGRLQGLALSLRAESTLITLTRDAVATSAIEGELLDPMAVRSSLARRLGLDRGGRASDRAADGITEVLVDATQRFHEPLTTERLFAWHGALFPTGRSGLARIAVASWRRTEMEPMQVVSGPPGRQRVHFEAPPSVHLPREIARFLAWFETPPEVDGVLVAGIAHVWFLTLHPFEDGNGRIARAIADMALARADGSPLRAYSMSAQLEADRPAYYDELEKQQRGSLDVTDWLEWFLASVDRAVDRSESILATVLHKDRVWRRLAGSEVNARQSAVVNRMFEGFKGHLSTSKYARLAKCSTDSALRDIVALVERGILVRNPGGGRSTSYRLVTYEELAED